MKKAPKIYRIAFILDLKVRNHVGFQSKSYHDAFVEAADIMKEDSGISAALIYSHSSAIVIKCDGPHVKYKQP